MSWVLVIVVAYLSIAVVNNLLSSNQAMNTSFNQLHLVNTYGAFGSVGKVRLELVVEGTDKKMLAEDTKWKAYEFKAKPTDVYRSLPIIAPYQPRIDWEIWFAAMSTPQMHPWVVHMVWKFLHNDEDTLSLIETNPFPDKPPEFIRVELYRYSFAPLSGNAVWKRERIGSWLPPLSKQTPGLREFIEANGWETY